MVFKTLEGPLRSDMYLDGNGMYTNHLLTLILPVRYIFPIQAPLVSVKKKSQWLGNLTWDSHTNFYVTLHHQCYLCIYSEYSKK